MNHETSSGSEAVPGPGAMLPGLEMLDSSLPFLAAAQPATAAMIAANSRMLAAATDINLELFRFVSERLKRDFMTGERVASCRNMSELMEVSASIYRTAFSDYQRELGRLTEIGTHAASETYRAMTAGIHPEEGR